MIPVLVEPNYADNPRFFRLLDGVTAVAKKKRMEVITATDAVGLPESRVWIVVGASSKWTTACIAALNERGIHPLVFGFQLLDTMQRYSALAPNYTQAAYRLTRALLTENVGKTAILGYNEDSLPDRLREIGIRYALNEAGVDYEIFVNHGDAFACLDDFASRCEDIKNIVCCNGEIAVKLWNDYPQLLQERKTCSCMGLKMSEYSDIAYPVCKCDYYAAGGQLAKLYLQLVKEKDIHSVVMTFDMELVGIGKESFAKERERSGSVVDFYGDESLKTIEAIENMLSSCDETDEEILTDILAGLTYESIAEKRFLAVNTVKWRIKRMLKTTGAANKKELTVLMEKYRLKFNK